MDFRSLTYFSEVAETENFSRAASRLNRSQPALSRSIQELETELGLKLFERIGRHVAITSNGRALLERVRILLRDVEAVTEHARMLAAGKTSILRVGSTVNFIERVLPELLRSYRARWPQVEVFLQSEGGTALLTAIENGDIDIALTRHAEGAFVDAQLAFPTYVLAVLSRGHRLSGRKSLTIRDLEGERLLIAPRSGTSRSLFESACQVSRVRPRIALESHDINALVALAEVDQGVAVVPSSADTRGHAVTMLPILHEGKPLGTWTALVWDKRRKQPAYALDFVRQACEYLKKNYPGKELNLLLPVLPAGGSQHLHRGTFLLPISPTARDSRALRRPAEQEGE